MSKNSGYERLLAGGFAGAGALLLIAMGNVTEGSIILSALVGFFVGERNGKRQTTQQ